MRTQLITALLLFAGPAGSAQEQAFEHARANGLFAREGFQRCSRYLHGWLAQTDPVTDLIPRNLDKDRDLWVPKDSAADNFPFLLLSAALLDRPLFEGRVLEMLRTETRLTSRVGALPDSYSFSRQAFLTEEANLDAIVFGASEYAKDGLLAVTELLGPGPWSERMDALTTDILANARFSTPTGMLPLDSYEVNGEMLQVLCRSYWRTGEQRFLDAAQRIGDHYLLGNALPSRANRKLRLRDHGCEILAGLCELYFTMKFASPERNGLYRPAIHELVNHVLAIGRNDDGLFYNEVDPLTGDHHKGVADTFGYVLNGVYTLYLVDGADSYRDAVRQALAALPRNYRSFQWEGDSADGYADAIEGALGLHRFEPTLETVGWLESEARILWDKQQPDGTIERWHGDGNFARTSLMLALWKTRGLRLEPWREDLVLGAVEDGADLLVVMQADTAWEGRLVFDVPRHDVYGHLPRDFPRTNAFPEWFTVERGQTYRVRNSDSPGLRTLPGGRLATGLKLQLEPGREIRLRIH